MKGLYSFDDFSKVLVLRASYYLGECFVRNYNNLSWNIGLTHTAVVNMPVITGFKKKIELAPILVCENLLRRLVEGVRFINNKYCIRILETNNLTREPLHWSYISSIFKYL